LANKSETTKSTNQHVKRGRPRKTPESIKTRYLGFRLPEEEVKAIEKASESVGESVSEYVRKAIVARMEGRTYPTSSSSISYEIPPLKFLDEKSSITEGKLIAVSIQEYEGHLVAKRTQQPEDASSA
jgi:hypothetical protein